MIVATSFVEKEQKTYWSDYSSRDGKGIVLVLGGTEGLELMFCNTVLNWVANGLGGLPKAASAWVMYIFQSVFNFVVSGSGQRDNAYNGSIVRFG